MVTDEGRGAFRTLNGYREIEKKTLTAAMEDYLEMICRMETEGAVRPGDLARRLHVAPSSASKMIAHLASCGCVEATRYGLILPTQYGRTAGRALLRRHETVHRFLCALTGAEEELEQTEKIEHFISERTLRAMQRYLDCETARRDGIDTGKQT